jgi:hypothetical protein
MCSIQLTPLSFLNIEQDSDQAEKCVRGQVMEIAFVRQFHVSSLPYPKARACYGLLWQRVPAEEPIRDQMSLRFVTGRPVSDITTQFLQWGCYQLQAQGKTAWLLMWDNPSQAG